jgi:hypothetical protein
VCQFDLTHRATWPLQQNGAKGSLKHFEARVQTSDLWCSKQMTNHYSNSCALGIAKGSLKS